MALVQPFRALRPKPDFATAVAAPPYDVLNSEEARERAQGNSRSFLHISKPEIDLPTDTNPFADAVYAKGVENLERLIREDVLVRDDRSAYYGYELTMDGHRQTGIALTASVDAYRNNTVRRHELTRPDKEDDRVRQIEALRAQTGPVLLAHRNSETLRALRGRLTEGEPLYDVTADDGIRHRIWRGDADDLVDATTAAFEDLGVLYIADGHHRSAAADRVAGTISLPSAQYFLAVAFAEEEMRILDYNRVVKDLNGLTAAEFLSAIADPFEVTPTDQPFKPSEPRTFGLYLEGRWYGLRSKREPDPADPVGALDVSLLHGKLIEPILAISDPRRDPRIDFVGGIRGLEGLERRVDSGEMQLAFALYPTPMTALMAVADANALMPPKSTWFEPKLADGLLSHVLD